MIKIIIAVLILLSNDYDFIDRVARRCAGEGSHPRAMQICACSVRHRLEVGWARDNVLDAYYARDVPYSREGLEMVIRGLSGDCVGGEYFYISKHDVIVLGFNEERAIVSFEWDGQKVFAFRREEWGLRRK